MSSIRSDNDVVHVIQTLTTSHSSRNSGGHNIDMPIVGDAGFRLESSSQLDSRRQPLLYLHADSHSQPNSVSSSQQFTIEEQITTVRIPMRRPNWQFLEILREGGASGEVFTMKEIVHHVKNYIIKHHLFDPSDPRVVHCGNDQLGHVFQVHKFTINEAVPLFTKNSFPVPDSCIRIRRQLVKKAVETYSGTASTSVAAHQGESCTTSTVTSTTESEEEAVPAETLNESPGCASSAYLSSLPRLSTFHQDARSNSASRNGCSVNIEYGDEVDGAVPVVQVNLETDNQPMQMQTLEAPEEDSVSVQYDSDHFAVEYELEASSESEHSPHVKHDYLLVHKESDVEFFADYSDSENESDLELGEGDQWLCDTCHTLNHPYYRNCSKCWALRPHWLPESSNLPSSSVTSSSIPLPAEPSGSRHGYYAVTSESNDEQLLESSQGSLRRWKVGGRVRPRRIRLMSTSSSDRNSESLASEEEVPSSSCSQQAAAASASLSQPQNCQQDRLESSGVEDSREIGGGKWKRKHQPIERVSSKDMCVVCATRPKTGCIIHGSSGHQVCCYRCAKQLRRSNQPCPVCRKSIQKVIKNFVL